MIGSLARTYTTYACRESVRTLVGELLGSWHHRRAYVRARPLSRERGLRLNVGCGRNHKEGWVNIDPAYADTLRLDVREPMPFADGSVDVIYSEHVMEHLGYPFEVGKFLAESLRVLRPGGVFTFGLPDFRDHIRAYLEDDGEFYRKLFAYKQDAWIRRTRMHTLNWILRAYGHKYAYDLETLRLTLTEAGFVGARARAFDPALDSEERRLATMYLEARKA